MARYRSGSSPQFAHFDKQKQMNFGVLFRYLLARSLADRLIVWPPFLSTIFRWLSRST
jgi:hypothetical protein